MTIKRFNEIMNGDSHLEKYKKDNALLGLNIIAKYLPLSGVEYAEHDEIWACGVEELLKAGLTEEDATELRNLNWMIDNDTNALACFV